MRKVASVEIYSKWGEWKKERKKGMLTRERERESEITEGDDDECDTQKSNNV